MKIDFFVFVSLIISFNPNVFEMMLIWMFQLRVSCNIFSPFRIKNLISFFSRSRRAICH